MKEFDREVNEIRQDIYFEYERLKEENPECIKDEIIEMLYQSFCNLAERDYDSYLKGVGIIAFDYYSKFKRPYNNKRYEYLDRIEEMMDLNQLGEALLEKDKKYFFLMADYVINDYENFRRYDDFEELITSYPTLAASIANTYYPNSKLLLSNYQNKFKEAKKIDEFYSIFTPDLDSIYTSFMVFASSIGDYNDAFIHFCLKIDDYERIYPQLKEDLTKQFLCFYYSIQKEKEMEGKELETDDINILSFLDNNSAEDILSFFSKLEHFPDYVRVLHTFLTNYQGEPIRLSQDEEIRELVLNFSTKMMDPEYLEVEELSWFSFVDKTINSYYYSYQEEEEEEEEIDEAVQHLISQVSSHIKNASEDDNQSIIANNIIQVLALAYYNYFFDEENEIVSLIRNLSKEEFLETVYQSDTILDELVKNQLECSSDNEEYTYRMMELALKGKEGVRVYKKFHPDLREELEFFVKWKKQNIFASKFYKMPVKSPIEFYLCANALSELDCPFQDVIQILSNKLDDIYVSDPSEQEKLLTSFVQMYYVLMKNLMNKSGFSSSSVSLEDVELVRDLEVMENKDIITLLQKDEDTRKIVLGGWLDQFEVQTYLDIEKKVSSDEKIFIKKFIPPKKEQ